MNESTRRPWWLRARISLALVLAGWLCSVPAFVADDHQRVLLSGCHDSPGTPGLLPLAWAGLVLAGVAVCWGGWQLFTVLRRKSLRLGPGQALLCAVLPVALLAGLLQAAVLPTAARDAGPRRSPCMGAGLLEPAIR